MCCVIQDVLSKTKSSKKKTIASWTETNHDAMEISRAFFTEVLVPTVQSSKFQKSVNKVPRKFQKKFQKVPKSSKKFQKCSKKVPKKYPKSSKKNPKKFQNGSKKVPKKFQKNSIFLVRSSCLLVTLITCLKGHKSLRVLYGSVFQKCLLVSELVSE